MKWLFLPLSLAQGILILLWTLVCGLTALLIRPLFSRPDPVVNLVSRYLWCPVVLTISMVRVKVRGREQLPQEPVIYISNHTSQMDITVMVRAIPKPLFFVAKKELGRVPVLGHYMRAMGMILIDRKNRDMALQSMQEAAGLIKAGRNVITFPEGTRSKSGELLIFRRGSFLIAREGQIPIVPVGINGTFQVLPSGSLILTPGVVRVNIGKPIRPEEFRELSVEELADLARKRVGELVG